MKQALKAQGEEVEEDDDEADDEIREVVGGKGGLPLPGSDAAAAAGTPGAVPPAPLGAPSLGISDEQLAAMPPEVQARVRAAQALAARMASGAPPPAPAVPPPLPGAPAPAIIPAAAFKAPAPAAAPPPAVIPAAAFQAPQPAQPAAAAPAAEATPAAAANPILAAAQAAARRLAEQAAAKAAQQQQQPAAAQPGVPAANPALAGSLLQQMLAPGAPPPGVPGVPGAPPAAAGVPQPDAAAVLQQMMAPGAAGLPGAPGAAMPGAPGLVPGAAPGMVPGAAGAAGLAAAAVAPPAPAKHFETELEINDFPQHARWKVGAGWRALLGARAGCCELDVGGSSGTADGRPLPTRSAASNERLSRHAPSHPLHPTPTCAHRQVTHRETIRDIGELGAAVVVKGAPGRARAGARGLRRPPRRRSRADARWRLPRLPIPSPSSLLTASLAS